MIYIHIPYCHSKCTYCAFFSTVDERSITSYTEAVCKELRQRSVEHEGHPVKTLYLGGGTPSILPIEHLRHIFDTLHECYDLSQTEESTIECNPEDIDSAWVEAIKTVHPINRVSIGIQTFDDDCLQLLHRGHTSAQAIEALRTLDNAGYKNVSADLIYGLPGQDLSRWDADLQTLKAIDPGHRFLKHLSCYSLSIEPRSILAHQIAKGAIKTTDEETVIAQYRRLKEWSAAEGYEQYEISSFCQSGFHSRHNSRYWDRTPYIGIGAAAHRFDGRRRRWNVGNIGNYVNGVAKGGDYYEMEELSETDAYNEYLMTALRTTKGIEKHRIEQKYRSILDRSIRRFVKVGLIIETPSSYKPTEEGILHADGIASNLFL